MPNSNTSLKDEPESIKLKAEENQTLNINKPNGAQISCKITSGSGEVSLWKNGSRITGSTYFLSEDPGYPTSVHLNTSTLAPDGKWELYIYGLGSPKPDKKNNPEGHNIFEVKLLPKDE